MVFYYILLRGYIAWRCLALPVALSVAFPVVLLVGQASAKNRISLIFIAILYASNQANFAIPKQVWTNTLTG